MLSYGCYAEGTRLLCHFGTPHNLALRLVFALSHAKSNYSRTSTKCSRKSNHSRTYAKTGGGGVIRMVTYLKYVGAPTILERPASEGRALQKKEEPKSTGKNACATSHETRATSHASLLRRAGRGGPYTNFQPSTLNVERRFAGARNILRGGRVSLDRGAQGCLPRRGCSERGALC
jgi:hypothetical protein